MLLVCAHPDEIKSERRLIPLIFGFSEALSMAERIFGKPIT
jgi:hypothetical protein